MGHVEVGRWYHCPGSWATGTKKPASNHDAGGTRFAQPRLNGRCYGDVSFLNLFKTVAAGLPRDNYVWPSIRPNGYIERSNCGAKPLLQFQPRECAATH